VELEKIEVPDTYYYRVKMGKMVYEIELETLVAVMANQIISSNPSMYIDGDHEIALSLAKNEIFDFLKNMDAEQTEALDLFDNWFDDFTEFQKHKNKPFCKDLIVEFSDKSQWSIRLIDILSVRSGTEDDSFEIDMNDPLINDDDLLLGWIQENLTWNDISHFSEEIQRPQPEPDYNEEWKESFKIIKEWDNTFSILEFVSKTDIIEQIEDEDEVDD
jgi:hypothetical protein